MTKAFFVFLSCFFVLAIGCRDTGVATDPSGRALANGTSELPARPTVDDFDVIEAHRESAVSLRVEGAPTSEYRDKVSRFDVGVAEIGSEGDSKCVLLEPLIGSYKQLPWAPLDFYYNAPDSVDTEMVRGEPDVFFSGDEFNRNGSEDESYRTIVMDPKRPEITFLETHREPSSAMFYLGFEKGAMNYKGLIKIQAIKKNGRCVSETRMCDRVLEGENWHGCEKDSWKERIDTIRVHVNLMGVFSGNPISSIDVRVLEDGEKHRYKLVAEL